MTAISDEGIKADENNYCSVRTGTTNFSDRKTVGNAATERTGGVTEYARRRLQLDNVDGFDNGNSDRNICLQSGRKYLLDISRNISVSSKSSVNPFYNQANSSCRGKIAKMLKKLFNKLTYFKNRLLADDIDLGKYTTLNKGSEVRGTLETGNYCAIGRNVVFQGVNHNYKQVAMQHRFQKEIIEREPNVDKEKIVLGHDVWIGNNSIILPGVEIGSGAVVGAGAVVTKDVEPFEVVAGVPAKQINYRFSKEVRENLLELQWWNWSKEQLKQNSQLFDLDPDELKENLLELKEDLKYED